MRILYVDIDSLRPDHLGCYGYHRDTSPNIDGVAREAVIFNNCYVPDAPCLPSRTALFSGRCGFHTGVINHGGKYSEMFNEGSERDFVSTLGLTSWMRCLRDIGYKTTSISSFGERHCAWHWYAGFNEVFNNGKGGMEIASEVSPIAEDWLHKNGAEDNWFLHLNFWDPHTPYRTPDDYGNPFEDDPIPAWYTEEVRREHWSRPGPHSARECRGFGPHPELVENRKRQPAEIDSMTEARRMFDNYDTGVRYADEHLGRALKILEEQGVLDETIVIISADHGENLGELNIYGDHQTADHITSRVPLIVRWPGVTTVEERKETRCNGLIYAYDFAATLVEMLGGTVPDNWDGKSFADAFRTGEDWGRDYLVVSQGAWSCQRAVRFEDYICIRSYHDAYHGFPETMLYNVADDPHEQHDLAEEQPEAVQEAGRMLDEWYGEMMSTATHPEDPMRGVLKEGGPLHSRDAMPAYLERLRMSGREQWADYFEKRGY